ncbi:MAG TPA: hypothetical protein VFC99_01465 [Acidimicrobiia bacterium]|nr:hypothetical protein [Acidimicrobiia bacterium]
MTEPRERGGAERAGSGGAADAQAERIRRLQERRGTAAGRAAAAPGRPARRRPHHYNASRILLAGLSVTGFFSILAALGLSQPAQPVASTPAPAASAATTAQGSNASVSSPATPARAAPAPKPVTRSHGS